MNSINVVNLKIEKANAIKRFCCLRTITTLFRLIEIIFMIIIITRFSVKIPVKLSVSGEYLRKVYSAMFSPTFVFIIGNAIVVTLFLKSGRVSSSSRGPDPDPISVDSYNEYVEKKVKQVHFKASVECATKRDLNPIKPSTQFAQDTLNVKADFGVKHEKERKMMCRSKSGELARTEMQPGQLRRSVTEVGHGRMAAEEMSGEEFRRRVEDFIARQQRSLREDEFSAIVSY